MSNEQWKKNIKAEFLKLIAQQDRKDVKTIKVKLCNDRRFLSIPAIWIAGYVDELYEEYLEALKELRQRYKRKNEHLFPEIF